MRDALTELTERLEETARRLREGMDPDAAVPLVEDCARLAAEAGAELDRRTSAQVEPLPELPGQLPLAAAV